MEVFSNSLLNRIPKAHPLRQVKAKGIITEWEGNISKREQVGSMHRTMHIVIDS